MKYYPPEKLLVIGPAPQDDSQILDCRYETLKVPLVRLNRTRFHRLVRGMRSFRLLPELTVGEVKGLEKGFKPHVVFSVMIEQPWYHLAYRYAKSEKLPLVLIVHDIPEAFEKVYPWAKSQQVARNREVYRYASKRLCVSPEMVDYLEGVYGERGEVLYPNSAEKITPRPLIEASLLKEKGVLTMGYAGSLAYGYGEQVWEYYAEHLQHWAISRGVRLPIVPDYCQQSYHMFYLLMSSLQQRTALMAHLKARDILSVFHYLPLHLSEMGRRFGGQKGDCPITEDVSDRLLRLSFFIQENNR